MFSTHSHCIYGSWFVNWFVDLNQLYCKKINSKETNPPLATLVRMTASYFASWKNVDKNPQQLEIWCVENINSKMMVDSTRHHLINSNFIHHIIDYTSAIESVQDFLIKLGIKLLMRLLKISIISLKNDHVRLTNIINNVKDLKILSFKVI